MWIQKGKKQRLLMQISSSYVWCYERKSVSLQQIVEIEFEPFSELYPMTRINLNDVPMQPGDVPMTNADTSALERDFGFKPSTPLREGLRRFAEWYKQFYD